MAFKMNTSIGKIHAKTQGTKPHAKSVAMAQAPKPATGNVGMPSSPFHIEGNSNSPSEKPLSRNRNLRRKQIEARNKAAAEKGKKLNEKNSGGQGSGGGKTIKATTTPKTTKTRAQKLAKGLTSIASNENKRKKQSATNTANRKAGKKVSYDAAYADADKKKYGGEGGKAKFIKDAKAYNAKKKSDNAKKKTVVTTAQKSSSSISKPTVRDKALAQLKKDNKDSVKNNLVAKSRATKEEDKPKVKNKRGDTLRRKAEKQTSVSERNRLQNRADRKDGRAERRAARVARRSGNMTKAKAKEEIEKSRKKQKSTANRSLQDKGKVKTKTFTEKEKAKVNKIKNANIFTTKINGKNAVDTFDPKKIK